MTKTERVKTIVMKIMEHENRLAELNAELKDLLSNKPPPVPERPVEALGDTTRKKVYDALVAFKEISRQDLIKVTGMPPGTVSSAVFTLRQHGLLEIVSPGIYRVK